MATGRLYKNYTLDDDSYEVLAPGSTSLKKTDISGAKGSLRTIDSDTAPSDGLPSSVGLTTDDDGVTPYEEESADSEFHDSGVITKSADSIIELASPRSDSKSYIETFGGKTTQHRPRTRDKHSKSPPTHRSEHRSGYRPNYNEDKKKQQEPPAIISQDDANPEPESSNNMPEFFSRAVFQVVLRNPAIAHQLLKFGHSRLCGEHMEFLASVNKYQILLHEVTKSISGLYEEFFADGAPKYVNIPQGVNEKVNKEIRSSMSTALPMLETVFASAQKDVERTIYGDIYPQFVRYQMSVSAAHALGGNRGKYAGLGDCFVLTDPTKADNPIVFASDGFVKVTGHPRNEIIPRNCRFLQSPQTDSEAVKRIKSAVQRREESVELLLNKKKNGEPFWNLLYTTPLFGQDGNLVFFLGGQINCSTTIHSTSDVLKILASSREAEEDSRTNSLGPKSPPGPSRSFRHPFGSNARSSLQPRAPGMENSLVDRLSNMPLTSQFREFHTAYSNFIVINYSTWVIAFVSGGIIDLLFPIKAKTPYQSLAIGTEVFKFLGNHGSGSSVSWEFKSSVKNAVKSGQALSLDLRLCAKPSMGLERFISHWTPLKDGAGKVHWIALTLASDQRG